MNENRSIIPFFDVIPNPGGEPGGTINNIILFVLVFIGNRLHYVKDVVLKEDASKTRKRRWPSEPISYHY